MANYLVSPSKTGEALFGFSTKPCEPVGFKPETVPMAAARDLALAAVLATAWFAIVAGAAIGGGARGEAGVFGPERKLPIRNTFNLIHDITRCTL